MKTKKLLLWALVLMMALPIKATTYYVRSTGGLDTNNGLTPETAFLTFVKGINTVVNGDVIDISGTFSDFNRTISKSITIQGTDKNTAIFDGTAGNATTKPFSTFATAGTTIVIENVTFQNYNAAAFQCFTANTLNVRNVIFKNNIRTGSGGAIDMSVCNLSLEDCYFYNNSASTSGGAINISSGASNSSIAINRCLFENNRTITGGSAISYAAAAISGTASANFTITNSTFTGNLINSNATGTNMGVLNINPTNTGVNVKLINNTIAYNTIGSTGAGFTAGLFVRGTTNLVTLINNILFSNFDSQTIPVSKSISSVNLLKESRNNITDMDGTTFNWTSKTTSGVTMASGNISAVVNGSAAGQLGLASSLADNGGATKTLALSSNSIAVNAGYATGAPTVDQRNITRSGTLDVGSYELVKLSITASSNDITMGDITGTGNYDKDAPVSLTATANTGYRFVNWTEGGIQQSTDAIYSFTASTNRTLVANFATVAVSISESTNASSLTNCSTCDVVVMDGGTLTIDAPTTLQSITVEMGGKVTNDTGLTVATFTINSDANGTGTYVDKGTTTISGDVNVNQYLAAGRNWYISSPVSLAQSGVVKNTTGNSLWDYNEENVVWNPIIATDAPLEVMTGYVAKPLTSGLITFTGGTLNTGDKSISLNRTENTNSKRGFNLVGNPYPSYLDWVSAIDSANTGTTHLETSMWYRTQSSNSYVFATYNADGGQNTNGATRYIPPMQAFWVRVASGNPSGTLAITNEMRSHEIGTNPLKVRAVANTKQKVLRLQVTNGVNNDEAVVYFDSKAANGLDSYDSYKMSNGNPVPDIFTQIGGESLAINGMSDLNVNEELPLGFATGSSNTFAIQATEISNFDQGTKIILKDKLLNAEQELTVGTAYSFSSEAANTTNRFSLQFRSPSVLTGVESNLKGVMTMNVFQNAAGRIVIKCNDTHKGVVTVCNTTGQKLVSTITTGTSTELSGSFSPGVYFITISIDENNTTRKLIVK